MVGIAHAISPTSRLSLRTIERLALDAAPGRSCALLDVSREVNELLVFWSRARETMIRHFRRSYKVISPQLTNQTN